MTTSTTNTPSVPSHPAATPDNFAPRPVIVTWDDLDRMLRHASDLKFVFRPAVPNQISPPVKRIGTMTLESGKSGALVIANGALVTFAEFQYVAQKLLRFVADPEDPAVYLPAGSEGKLPPREGSSPTGS